MAEPARSVAMRMTAEEFLAYPVADEKAELVRGELRVTAPADGPHGLASANLLVPLGAHVKAQGLGRVFSDATGYEVLQPIRADAR